MTLFWQKKTVRNWQNTRFYQFSTVFWPKGLICYPISILRPDLESSHEVASNHPQIERKIKTSFFGPHNNFKTSIALGDENVHFWENKLYRVYQREKRTGTGAHVKKFKKLKVTNLIDHNRC